MKKRFLLHLFSFLCFCTSALQAVTLTGSNGTKVDFAGILSARPDGLSLKVRPGDKLMTVPWEKFNLKSLASEQPEIFKAYNQAVDSKKIVWLKMGVFEGIVTPQDTLKKVNELLSKPLDYAIYTRGYASGFIRSTDNLLHDISQIENVTDTERDKRFRIFMRFKAAIRKEIIPPLTELSRQIPNDSFSADDNKELYALAFKLEKFVEDLKAAFEYDRPQRDMQDRTRRFMSFIEELNTLNY